MVYRNNLVAAIKVRGKVLREVDNAVLIPFGSEYSVLLKNLNSVRTQVKVSIDGKDTTEGTWLVIMPNSSLELERYMRNGNFDRGNRFKFIERTSQIEDHRGIGVEDGLVRVEYKSEQVVVDQPIVRYYDQWYPIPSPYVPPCSPPWRHPWDRRHPYSSTLSSSQMDQNVASMNNAGITVSGSESQQQFVNSEWFATESHSDVLVLKLRGELAGATVVKAVTVDHKPACDICGTTNKATAQYCSKCGTALSLI